jgi:hypothetical protein
MMLALSLVIMATPLRAEENPLAPKIYVDFGGLSGWNDGGGYSQSEDHIDISWLSEYISALYRYGVGLAVTLAVVMIMAGGFLWLMSGGSPDRVGKAKEFIISAFSGVLLALFSFIILQGINPELVKLATLNILTPNNPDISSSGPLVAGDDRESTAVATWLMNDAAITGGERDEFMINIASNNFNFHQDGVTFRTDGNGGWYVNWPDLDPNDQDKLSHFFDLMAGEYHFRWDSVGQGGQDYVDNILNNGIHIVPTFNN